ncbi:NAD(P)/FAD-dependent oxidoreductase [Aliihoeflea sp. PC F10.4]
MTNGRISYWHEALGGIPTRRPSLQHDISADVCIVGAGFTGLWTAYYLKQLAPDIDIAVVEKNFAGFGASGRNGGWLSGGFGWNRETYLKSSTRAAVISMQDQLRHSVSEVADVAEREGIDADILKTDQVTFAVTASQAKRMREHYEYLRSWEVGPDRLQLLEQAEAASRIKVRNASLALATLGVARVQPAKLVRGLADLLERRGVRIFEGTCATKVTRGSVHTDKGSIKASLIVRATEGYTPSLAGLKRSLLTMGSNVAVTTPIPAERWDQIGWAASELMADYANSFSYLQRTRDDRILIGGRGIYYNFGNQPDVDGHASPRAVERLRQALDSFLPQIADIPFEHSWCGALAVPRDWCASVGFDRTSGIAWGGGYVGSGVTTSNLAGRTIADLLLGHKTERTGLPWVDHRSPNWEPEPMRWLGVKTMFALYGAADKRDAARPEMTRPSSIAKWANYLSGR